MTPAPFSTRPTIKWLLAVVLVGFMVWIPFAGVKTDIALAISAWLELILMFLLAALLAPGMFPWAGRATAGLMVVGALPMLGAEMWKLIHTGAISTEDGAAKFAKALTGFFTIGVLIGGYAVLGKDLRERTSLSNMGKNSRKPTAPDREPPN